MSQDGAEIGYSAAQGLDAVLGGKQAGPEDRITDMAAYLDDAPDIPNNYENAARRMGKVFLDYLREHPEAADLPVDDEGDFERDENGAIKQPYSFRLVRKGLYTTVKEATGFDGDGLSGFQVGWAANAARHAVGLSPVSNPAIVDIQNHGH